MNEKIGDRPLVVVVGGGFGGLNVVQGLKDAPARILLVGQSTWFMDVPREAVKACCINSRALLRMAQF